MDIKINSTIQFKKNYFYSNTNKQIISFWN